MEFKWRLEAILKGQEELKLRRSWAREVPSLGRRGPEELPIWAEETSNENLKSAMSEF